MNNPVFIVGPARSGTSLLYRTLLKHSAFQAKQLCLEETKIFQRPLVGYDALKLKDQSLRNYMMADAKCYDLFLKHITNIATFQIFLNALPGIRFFCRCYNMLWIVAGNHILIKNYFKFAKKARNCKRIVEKTPSHINYMERIFFTYPDAKILITIRHPVSVFSSYIRRSLEEPDESWLRIDKDKFISAYRNDVETALRISFLKRKGCKIVLYEDFVNNPHGVFQETCRFLEEPFEPQSVLGGEESLASWKPDPYLSKPISKETKNWSDYLPESSALLIEEALADLMDKLGYNSVVSP